MSTLDALFSWVDEADLREPLERFIARALVDAGVWASTRTSDGITKLRVVERAPTHLRVCGKLYKVDQTKRAFWVDIERSDCVERGMTWSLFFDVDRTPMSGRRACDAVDWIKAASDVEWNVSLSGVE